ncbi:flavin reductase family protein [Martelella radicis]|uniref:Flavin reductase (DIM6/NTAB) family NADH-FMN oxidoreductase RutF n=1 Tax=Martelella radicis TaxID=1397476 RepID=A0A7W6P9C3_9HYPH|nr:flavin reductase family protein [Martelella radicis]MBB4121660.1 flavin reductase (DIM6/NTAB) family NADH-FMN oxidoreductase RutF [Martelella radicis]
MFYSTDTNAHGLPHDPFKAIVSPRPIGWIGSRSARGRDNLAPYSFFNAVSSVPPVVMFSSDHVKDSLRNIEETGVFTVNLASRDLAEQMNATSASLEHGESEFEAAGLASVTGKLVDAPYVGEAYAVLECRLTGIMAPPTLEGAVTHSRMVFGQVVAIHIKDEALTGDGRLDMGKVRPLARLGYRDYCDGGDVFEMVRPR